ncbi:bifunctional tetrahydrofolate synthase/dihydrofolate synthase, partial [Vibrio splendidus]
PASLNGPRAATAAELCQSLPQGVEQHSNPVAAFEAALASVKGDDVVLVVGSFHTVGEVLEHWQKKGN